jgi:hypothetical protein
MRFVNGLPDLAIYRCGLNLFRDPRGPALVCAVPADRPVPGFLNTWSFVRALQPGAELPLGYDEKAAAVGIRFNGFYLFQSIDGMTRRKTVVFADTVYEPAAHHPSQALAVANDPFGLAEVG